MVPLSNSTVTEAYITATDQKMFHVEGDLLTARMTVYTQEVHKKLKRRKRHHPVSVIVCGVGYQQMEASQSTGVASLERARYQNFSGLRSFSYTC
ncbi:hypothetical protein TNCV_1400751 [Trichonephila clavipes]|nr:hypothetical protein TNCV_1400751 [Trichonephila clavipes]